MDKPHTVHSVRGWLRILAPSGVLCIAPGLLPHEICQGKGVDNGAQINPASYVDPDSYNALVEGDVM